MGCCSDQNDFMVLEGWDQLIPRIVKDLFKKIDPGVSDLLKPSQTRRGSVQVVRPPGKPIGLSPFLFRAQ
jgi:hypothetical protein